MSLGKRHTTVTVESDSVLNLHYDIMSEKIRTLYSKAKRHQWDGEVLLDWTHQVDPSAPLLGNGNFLILQLPIFKKLSRSKMEYLNAHLTAQTLSQFLHGEQAAMLVAARLVEMVPDYEAKLCAASQVTDEARHTEVFEKFIRKCGIVYPVGRWLEPFLKEVLGCRDWLKMLIATQIIIEGTALTNFHNYRAEATDVLLCGILDNVLRDEARHVGFGHLLVRDTLATMHPDDREAAAETTFRFTMLAKKGFTDIFLDIEPVLNAVDVDMDDLLRDLVQAEKQGLTLDSRRNGRADPLLDFVVPALERVGAITDRTRPKYREGKLSRENDASEFFGTLMRQAQVESAS